MKQGKIYFITILILLLIVSCSDTGHDQRLEHACELISKSPNEALSALEGIDYGVIIMTFLLSRPETRHTLDIRLIV